MQMPYIIVLLGKYHLNCGLPLYLLPLLLTLLGEMSSPRGTVVVPCDVRMTGGQYKMPRPKQLSIRIQGRKYANFSTVLEGASLPDI